MKKLIAILLCLSMLFCFCGCLAESNEDKNTQQQTDTQTSTEHTYKLVEPTQQEIDEIATYLGSKLKFTHFSQGFDCEKDDVYKYLLDKYYYVPQDLSLDDWEVIYEKDPKNLFGELAKEGDMDGDVFDLPLWGYVKIKGESLDWLVGEVWNGKVDHDRVGLFRENDFYWHEGNYYAPFFDVALGSLLGDIRVDSVQQLPESKLLIEYMWVGDYGEESDDCGTAVIGLKERDDGFRFWSIFSTKVLEPNEENIDTQIEQNEQEKNENPNADFLASFFGDCVYPDETDDYSYIQVTEDEDRVATGIRQIPIWNPEEKEYIYSYIGTDGRLYDERPESANPEKEFLYPIRDIDWDINKYGYVDSEGNCVIEHKYADAHEFSDGLAAVELEDKTLGYINTLGEVVIKTEEEAYSALFNMFDTEPTCDFSDGIAYISPDYCINKNGEQVLENLHVYGMYNCGLIPVRNEETELYGYADAEGNIVIDYQFEVADSFLDEGIAPVSLPEHVSDEQYVPDCSNTQLKTGFIDTAGNAVIPLEYCQKPSDAIRPYHIFYDKEGIIELYKEGYICYFDLEGTLLGKVPAHVKQVWVDDEGYLCDINLVRYYEQKKQG